MFADLYPSILRAGTPSFTGVCGTRISSSQNILKDFLQVRKSGLREILLVESGILSLESRIKLKESGIPLTNGNGFYLHEIKKIIFISVASHLDSL